MRDSKKSEGGLLKPPPPDRIGLSKRKIFAIASLDYLREL